ncbi:hypothetical protein Nepgr_023174 [Nepenthes gracilis]|uniref:Cytochrome P450 n=1 Tax=Nepenthes gracilis TaxID=150966 RepID=A0AAD3T3D2_NEPGR|nr:hypothetical protein Nepgr_023174 [Nepenthes gracilis]
MRIVEFAYQVIEIGINLQPIIILFPIFLIFFLYRRKPATTKRLPPSPPKLPIIGNLHQLGTHPHRSLHSLSQKYGDLMLLHLGSKPALVVSSASAAREILKTHDQIFSDRPQLSIPHKLLYKSTDISFAPYGEYWREMRSLFVLNLLSSKRVQSFRAIRREEVALMIKKIEKLTPRPMDLSGLFLTLTNDVICRVAFGRKYGGEEGGAASFGKILKEFEDYLGHFCVGDFIPWLAWIQQVNGLDAKVDRVAKDIDQVLDKIVEDHTNRLDKQNIDNHTEEMAKDFIDVLLEVQRSNTVSFQMDKNNIKALTLDAFVAGTDTTYTVLEWTMTELLRHPQVMKELQREIREIVKSKVEVSENDLEKMMYLKAVIKETLRLHPSVPLLLPHKSTEDVKIKGYDIAAGTQVIVNSWAIQRDPTNWEEPEKFYPERFFNSTINFKGKDFQLIPFGSGRRGCPGISFATVIIELVIANLMHKFDWCLPVGGRDDLDMSETTGLSAHREIHLLAVATPHSHS